jgi:hypothetical protein
MSGVIGMTTYDAACETRAIRGVPAVALRVGVALENWARAAAQREAARPVREPRRVVANARIEHDVRVGIRTF